MQYIPKKTLLTIFALLLGIVVGGYLFSDTQPRSFLTFHECQNTCLEQKELLGLLGSVGIQKFPDLIPSLVKETEKTVVIKHPFPQSDLHYVIIPKKDIRDAQDISSEYASYITDAYAVMSAIIREKNLRDYKIITNGPGYQTVGYLHFQLVSLLP